MTSSAFSATFSDFRIVRSRRIAQFVLEVPLEQADAALAALGGLPRPDAETWVGIARLEKETKPQPQAKREHKQFSELPLPQQAGIIANEPAFWAFANSRFLSHPGSSNPVDSEARAAEFIRVRCGVASRSELSTNPDAAECWREILRQYDAWRLSPWRDDVTNA